MFLVKLEPWSARILAIVAATPLLHCGGKATGRDDGSGGTTVGADGGSSGEKATGGGGSGAVSGEAGAGGSSGSFPCMNPTPLDPERDTGYEQCEGFKHRPEVVTCTSLLPRPTDWTPGPEDGCEADADCTEMPYGHCDYPSGDGGGLPARLCHYGCIVDSDCPADRICVCGPEIGVCTPAKCSSDAECGDGLLCATHFDPLCEERGFACQHPDDECISNSDCPTRLCYLESDGVRRCAERGCGTPGRPFLIGAEARLAAKASRADWTSSEIELDARRVDASERAALGAAWLRNALMEHASVAAFARFTLELLAVGAPAELIRDSNTAASDETRHAELCFALASEYLGEPVGPGPLRIDGALDGISLEKLVVTTIAEGCVGETVAAIEAAEQLAHASDPVVCSVLSRISDDETRHAELAWRFVAWALEQQPSLRAVASREFERHSSASGSVSDEGELDLSRHGVLSERTRAELRRAVLDGVIRDAASVLMDRGSELSSSRAPEIAMSA